MKALSIQQPWAVLIAIGQKNIGNRNRPTKYRGRIYIHTGKRFDPGALEWLLQKGISVWESLALHSNLIFRGGIIGEVDIIDCVTGSDSRWFAGPYGFVLANPVLYEKPIPYKGRPGLFEITFVPEK